MAPMFHMEAMLPSSISPKISSILQAHIYPQVGRVFHSLAKFKSFLVKVLSKKRAPRSGAGKHTMSSKKSRSASFVKLQFTWPATSSAQVRAVDPDVTRQLHPYYDSMWSVVVPAEADEVRGAAAGEGDGDGEETAECGYLCWLEEERSSSDDAAAAAEEGDDHQADVGDGDGAAANEIDRLAERFIARCHAKFLLEKQESYRRFQEMMARSM